MQKIIVTSTDREVNWLKFNERVLLQACDKSVPLLERLKFLSIYKSNKDEFFEVRMSRVLARSDEAYKSGIINTLTLQDENCEKIYNELKSDLLENNIELIDTFTEESDKKYMKESFNFEVKDFLSPQIIDSNHPFPFLKNKETYLFFELDVKGSHKFGIISLSNVKPYYMYKNDLLQKIVLTEDQILAFADSLFPYKILNSYKIRATRNSNVDIEDDDCDDFSNVMTKIIKMRKSEQILRFEVSKKLSNKAEEEILKKLNIKRKYIYISKVPFSLNYVFDLTKIPENSDYIYKQMSQFVFKAQSGETLAECQKGNKLIAYPYMSMDYIVNLIIDAANDPNVFSIKMSLYRLAKNSKIISALMYAAGKDKEVICVVELRARFDEENNIEYSKMLKDNGCRIIYGHPYYKVHAKMLLISSKKDHRISYVSHIGTGNFNEKTASLYTDLAYITNNFEVGKELNNVFNSLAINDNVTNTKNLLVSPFCYKTKLLEMIKEESSTLNGEVTIKVNSFDDKELIGQLYEASSKNTKVNLYIRGICTLLPGVEGLSENIHVKAILGQYLEHFRLFYFKNLNKLYIGSGDLLTRNVAKRVEVFTEVLDEKIKNKLINLINFYEIDTVNNWEMDMFGNYNKIKSKESFNVFDLSREFLLE